MTSTGPADHVAVDPAASLSAQEPEATIDAPSNPDAPPSKDESTTVSEATPSALEQIVDSLIDNESLTSIRQSQRET
jgi:hypothetical protein